MKTSIAPHVTEKSVNLRVKRIYTLISNQPIPKPVMKQIFQKQYNVTVVGISSTKIKGKAKSFRGRRYKVSDRYKYYLTLASGDDIPNFYS